MRQSYYKQQDSISQTDHFENHVFYNLIFQFLLPIRLGVYYSERNRGAMNDKFFNMHRSMQLALIKRVWSFQVLALFIISYVALGKLLNLLESHFPLL